MTELDFRGKRIAITGTLPLIRAEAIIRLEKMGAIYKTSVTKDTDYLIVGDLSKVSHKIERAQKLQQAGQRLIMLDGEVLFPGNSY